MAWQTWINSFRRSLVGGGVLVAIFRHANTSDQLHHEKLGVHPQLNHVGMVHEAKACRSASKRATTCLVSIPSLITLRATRRWTGSSY